MSNITIHVGSNLDTLPNLPDNSVDSIVTDPPYELGFMGKSWDASGIAYSVDLWRQCLRVLKPGGHLLAFSGSRTYHRMTCAIEDAGFEIRDQIQWVYGSGFPKSHDVSKAIDKAAGAVRQIVGTKTAGIGTGKSYGKIVGERENTLTNSIPITAPATEAAKQWDGWGTALKPAHEPICVARKPLEGTVAANVLKWGTGAINVDGCRVPNNGEQFGELPNWGGGKQLSGRASFTEQGHDHADGGNAEAVKRLKELGRFPANLIHDGSQEVLDLFPETGKSQGGRSGHTAAYGGGYKQEHYGDEKPGFGDSGSAARFFYCPKANKKDRDDGCEGMKAKVFSMSGNDSEKEGDIGLNKSIPRRNHHPTVKPTELMRYLCRLVTPPNGTILDPFMGSGSTGRGAVLEGFNFIGCELSEEYAVIARARIDAALKSRQTPT